MSDEASTRSARIHEALAQYDEVRRAESAPSPSEFAAGYPDDLRREIERELLHERFLRQSVPEPSASFPRKFGPYLLLDCIGAGGMGIVYKTTDSLGRTVALKTIRRDEAKTLDLARFRREALVAASADHPNIVRVYEGGEHEGLPYFTMQLVEGPTLQAAIETFSERPRSAAELLEKVARAVDHAHGFAIIHRDIKPANILLARGTEPLLADFGLAKKAGLDGQTEIGRSLGTLEYMSPEQARGELDKVDSRSDVYSLGVILYALLTGKPPFHGKTPELTLRAIQDVDPPHPAKVKGRPVPGDLATICLHCMNKNPAERYATALELAEDLRRWLDGVPIRARRPGIGRRLWLGLRRHRALSAALALLLVLAASFAIYRFDARTTRREDVLERNRYVAERVSGEFLDVIRTWADAVEQAANDEAFGRSLGAAIAAARSARTKGEITELAEVRALNELARAHHARVKERLARKKGAEAMENWNVLDARGTMLARTPTDEGSIGNTYADRDYFVGARGHHGKHPDQRIHVSNVYRSRLDRLYKFDVSAPIAGEDGGLLGVVALSITTDRDFGLKKLHDERHAVILFARFEQSNEYVVFMHPKYAHRALAYQLPSLLVPVSFGRNCEAELAAGSQEAVSRPVDYGEMAAFPGKWLAGYAPVGQTGFVIAVQDEEP